MFNNRQRPRVTIVMLILLLALLIVMVVLLLRIVSLYWSGLLRFCS